MKTQGFLWVIGLGSLLIVFAGISPAVAEAPVMKAMEAQFTGTPPQVMALESYYTAPATSPDAVGWAETMKPSEAMGTGRMPATVSEEFSEDDLRIPEDRWVEDTYPDN